MKKIPLITLISFFLLIPNIDAVSCNTSCGEGCTGYCTYKYHYYYFNEPYSESGINAFPSVNYTRFADYRDWEVPEAEQITLSNGGSNTDTSTEWNLGKFYAMWDKLYSPEATTVCKGETCSKDLKEKNKSRYYHAHGAYTDQTPSYANTHRWDGVVERPIGYTYTTPTEVQINDPNLVSDSSKSCATLKTTNTLFRSNVSGRPISNGVNYDNTYIAIERKLDNAEDIKAYTEVTNEDGSVTKEGNIVWGANLTDVSFTNCNYKGENKVIATNGYVYSPALYRITATTQKYKCSGNVTPDLGKCNDTSNAQSICAKQTIEVVEDGGNIDDPESNIARAEASIKQDISLTNLLTPTKIYQGGGVKIGFLYKAKATLKIDNTTIKYDGSSLTYVKKQELKNKIKNKLESVSINPEDNIQASNFYFKDDDGNTYKLRNEDGSEANLQIECNQNIEGDVFDTSGKVITTTCTILLPKSEVSIGSGIVKYVNGITGNGINNEFYTPIKYNGDLNLYATFSGLSAIQTSGTFLSEWDGASDITIKYNGASSNCTVTTYPRFYNDDNKTYKFIYRPIDITNPFPNRNAGVNWYDWYSDTANKTKLEKSYSNLEYTMEINKETSNEIKNYNSSRNYFNWDGITEDAAGNVRSEFVERYKKVVTP